MCRISRRSLLTAAASAGFAALVPACSSQPVNGNQPTQTSTAPPEPVVPPPPPPPEKPAYVQIVAHQDDDLLFMNPDLLSSIRSGSPTATIFITAGEEDWPQPAAALAYAADRQKGSRAAYALMAEVADDWTGEAFKVDDTHEVELYTLKAKPQIQLVFMNLPENADHLAAGGRATLTRLWEGKDNPKAQTLVPVAAKVTQTYAYTRETLIGVLAGLLAHFQPTVLRAQDNVPDLRYDNDPHWGPYHDHPDHVMAALFTDEAVRAYRKSPQHSQFIHINYRDYNVADVPLNLGPEQQKQKIAFFAAYRAHDNRAKSNGAYDRWSRSMYYRWPRGTSWVGRNADGRLQAFAVRSGEVITWWQQRDGSWTGPASLGDGGGPLAPSLSVASDGHGRMHVFVRRLDNHNISAIVQTQPNGGWGKDWTNLGNPNLPNNTLKATQMGVPSATLTGSGRLVVFVKNAGGGVSYKQQVTAAGEWRGSWSDLGGADVQDGLCAITTNDGRIEVFASTRDKVLRWSQPHADRPFALDVAFPSRRPSGPPVVAKGPNGGLYVLYRAADSGEVLACSQDGSGKWSQPMVLPGHCGPGGPAVVSTGKGADTRLLAFSRDAGTGVNMAKQTGPNVFGPWTGLAGEIIDYPNAAVMADGSVVALGISPGGRLYVNQQKAPGVDSPFRGWQSVGA